ncbi:hypothetical protein D3C80_1470890 [compost metagenome]
MGLAVKRHLAAEDNRHQRQQDHASKEHPGDRGNGSFRLSVRLGLEAVVTEDRPHGEDDYRTHNLAGEGHRPSIDPLATAASKDFVHVRQEGIHRPGYVIHAAGAQAEDHGDTDDGSSGNMRRQVKEVQQGVATDRKHHDTERPGIRFTEAFFHAQANKDGGRDQL